MFGVNGLINWQYAFMLFVGMTIGSYVGAHYAIKIGDKWMRNILLIVIFALAVKLILGI